MLEFHGLSDGTISYTGGVRRKACLPTIPHWIQSWAERDGLGTTNVSSKVPGALEGSTAVRYEFGGDSDQGLVTHIMDGTVSFTTVSHELCWWTNIKRPGERAAADEAAQNIGHDWPSTVPNDDTERDGDPSATFNASSIIIGFFSSHSLG